MRRLLGFGGVAAAFYAGLVALLFFSQASLLYPASGRQSTAAEAGLSGFEDLVLRTEDGERLVAWWKPPQPGRALILYFHGNGGSLWNRRLRARSLAEGGRGILLASYRGYSGSTGIPTEDGLRRDARAAYDWAARAYEPSRLVLYGESLGSGVAVRLASERAVGGLILDAPFTSAAEVAALAYWFVPVHWLMRDQYRSIEIIGQVKAPILIMHGDRDEVVPFALGERLYAAAPQPKRFVRLPNVSHSRVLESGGREAVEAFLAEIESAFLNPPPDGNPAPRP
ncbi:MAG TPA: alpha/beta hydrolase [Microvirga sp.]|nr:alpha/beta hydrolase [Microvirga sp.]